MRTWFFEMLKAKALEGAVSYTGTVRLLCGLSLDPVVGSVMLHRELLQDGNRPCSLLMPGFRIRCLYTDYTGGFPSNKFTFYN